MALKVETKYGKTEVHTRVVTDFASAFPAALQRAIEELEGTLVDIKYGYAKDTFNCCSAVIVYYK